MVVASFARIALCVGFFIVGCAFASSQTQRNAALGTVSAPSNPNLPLLINTWNFNKATAAGYASLKAGKSAVDAVIDGCGVCEERQCGDSVGWGGSPDENGETTLDAMIMDATTHRIGAVAALRNIKSAIRVARFVMDHTQHTMLAGDQATAFAVEMGFPTANLSSTNKCQPNYWNNVTPPNTQSCGPYKPSKGFQERASGIIGHDTISMIAIDANGRMASGTTTNGLTFKIPGRVGDGPIPGSGSYSDDDVGGCGATGNGDVLMRFLPCITAVELMRAGHPLTQAARMAMDRVKRYYPTAQGAIFVVDKAGNHGGACNNWSFEYALASPATGGQVQTFQVQCQ